MPATASSPDVTFQIAEEGEAIGTVRQFADRLRLSPAAVLSCLQESETAPIVLSAEESDDPLLLVTSDGLDVLLSCAGDGGLL